MHISSQLTFVCFYQEKQLRVNIGITKLREKVKEHQEKVGKNLVDVKGH